MIKAQIENKYDKLLKIDILRNLFFYIISWNISRLCAINKSII